MWNLNKFKNNIAVITENNEHITYEKLNNYCIELTSNIKKRCLVFNLCANEIGSLVGYIGFLNAKIVPVMLKADLDEILLTNMIETYKPAYLHLPSILADRFDKFEKVYSNIGYTLLKTNFTEEFELNEDLALLSCTMASG